MSHDVAFIPAVADAQEARDLVYREQSSRARGLYVLMQDGSPRAGADRTQFLRACFRHVVASYLDSDRPVRAQVFLRECATAFDAISRAVDTRLDGYEGLGVFVIVREAGSVHILCARSAPSRVRWRGVFVPLATPDVDGVVELPIETARSQHDLFAQSLPETLALYRIAPVHGEPVELLLGGSVSDMAVAVDLATQPRKAGEREIDAERLQHTVLLLSVDAVHAADGTETFDGASRPRFGGRPARAAVIGAASLVVIAAGIAGVGAWRNGGETHRSAEEGTHTALKQTPAPPPPQKRVVEDVDTLEERAAEKEETKLPQGFGVAWQQSYRAAVTSSPALAGDAVIFGGRDGRVYSIHRGTGEKQWSYAAQGGVGASPVVKGATVIAADYGGNVVRLRAGDGGVVWKRALREKIVSTPAMSGERVLAATTQGRMYALSLDTGRVLWKFAARGQVRGGITWVDGVFLVPSNDGRLYALVEETGARRWVLPLGGPVTSSPASDGEIVVIGSASGDVVAVDLAQGKPRWKYRVGTAVNSSLALMDGAVYAGAGDSRLYCIDASNGELRWRFDTEGVILSRPFVDDGRVLVTSYDGAVYCLDAATGKLIDRYATDESIYSSPLVVDGRVFFGNNAGRFYCLDAPGS